MHSFFSTPPLQAYRHPLPRDFESCFSQLKILARDPGHLRFDQFDPSNAPLAGLNFTMAANQRIAIVSVYDKTGLLDLAKGLVQNNVRILASGGTAKMIRDSGFPVE